MDVYAKAKQLKDKDYKQIMGVKKASFDTVVTILLKIFIDIFSFQAIENYLGMMYTIHRTTIPSLQYNVCECIRLYHLFELLSYFL